MHNTSTSFCQEKVCLIYVLHIFPTYFFVFLHILYVPMLRPIELLNLQEQPEISYKVKHDTALAHRSVPLLKRKGTTVEDRSL
jgi:hypothetical protein